MSKPINLSRSDGESGWWVGGRPVLLRALPRDEFDCAIAVVREAVKLARSDARDVQAGDLVPLQRAVEALILERRRARGLDLDP